MRAWSMGDMNGRLLSKGYVIVGKMGSVLLVTFRRTWLRSSWGSCQDSHSHCLKSCPRARIPARSDLASAMEQASCCQEKALNLLEKTRCIDGKLSVWEAQL